MAKGLLEEVQRLLAAGGADWLREQLAGRVAVSPSSSAARPVRSTRARPPVRLSPASGRERRRNASPSRGARGRRAAAGASAARGSPSPRRLNRARRSEEAEGGRSDRWSSRRREEVAVGRSRSRSHHSPGAASQISRKKKDQDIIKVHSDIASAIQCNLSLVEIKDGTYNISDGGNVGSKVEYRCPQGKYPHPGYIRECQYNGLWTKQGIKAECKDVRCPWVLMFENGEVYPRKPFYNVEDVLHFQCFAGFDLKGSVNRTCQLNGKWSGPNTVCEDHAAHCPNPVVPIGGIRSGTSYNMEDKVTYDCHQDLVMFGSKTRQCMKDKTWSGAEPTCRQWYTYDSIEEVSEGFSSSISLIIGMSVLQKTDEVESDRKIKILKDGLMNIFIVLDVEEKNFDTAKESSQTFIEKVSSFDIQPRYAVISYATAAIRVVSLMDDDSSDPNAVIESLADFKYKSHQDKQGTNTRAALHTVYQMLTEQENKYKRIGDNESFMKTHNIILLMTDGKYIKREDPQVEIKKIRELLNVGTTSDNPREEYLDVYVFGLGAEITQPEINNLASKKDGEKHAFHLENTESMKKAFEHIIVGRRKGNMAYEVLLLEEEKDIVSKDPGQGRIIHLFYMDRHNRVARSGAQETCKGSILSPNFILTAAHCFHLEEPVHQIKVEIDGRLHSVKRLIRHPQYDPTSKKDRHVPHSFDYDAALLELQTKVTFSSSVRPICIPCTETTSQVLRKTTEAKCNEHRDTLLSGEIVDAMFIAEKDRKDMEEMKVKIKRGNKRNSCLEDAKKVRELKDVVDIRDAVSDQFLCTGGTEPQIDPPTCKGDSGGPLIIQHKKRYIQVGIISWGTVIHCKKSTRLPTEVPKESRDFHQSLFTVIPWIQKVFKEVNEPLNFIEN
ncbi:complement factor B-like [Rhinophrynus dorsalis]